MERMASVGRAFDMVRDQSEYMPAPTKLNLRPVVKDLIAAMPDVSVDACDVALDHVNTWREYTEILHRWIQNNGTTTMADMMRLGEVKSTLRDMGYEV